MSEQSPPDLFVGSLNKAIETIWTYARDADWNTLHADVKPDVLMRIHEGRASQRMEAFTVALRQAYARTLDEVDIRSDADAMFYRFVASFDSAYAAYLADDLVKVLLVSSFPDIEHVSTVCADAPVFTSSATLHVSFSPNDVAIFLGRLVRLLRAALCEQDVYRGLVQRPMRRVLKSIVPSLRSFECNDESRYRVLVAEMYRSVPYADVVCGQQIRPVRVDEVFISPDLEREAPGLSMTEMILAMHAGSEAVHPRDIHKRGGLVGERVSLREVIRTSSNIVVLGEAGSGKSTLLKYLTVVCAEGRGADMLGITTVRGAPVVPVFVSLSEYAIACASQRLDYSLLHHMYAMASEQFFCVPSYGFFEHALDEGRCLVCLDGLDKIVLPQERRRVCDAILSLARRYPQSRYIVTARSTGYHEMPLEQAIFAHYTLSPFSDGGIKQLLSGWFQMRLRDPREIRRQVDAYVMAVTHDPHMQVCARSPLMLMMGALVLDAGKPVQCERHVLYDACVDVLIAQWVAYLHQQQPDEAQRLDAGRLRRIVERLAYEMLVLADSTGVVYAIGYDELEQLLRRVIARMSHGHQDNSRAEKTDTLDSEVAVLMTLVRRCPGLVREYTEGLFAFVHLSFQEYLAACDSVNRCRDGGVDAFWHDVQGRLFAPHWRPVLLFVMEILDTADDLVTDLVLRILERGTGDMFEPVLHRYVYLAANIIAVNRHVAPDVRRLVVDALLAIARNSSGNELQDVFHVLGRMVDDGRTDDALLQLANDELVDHVVRLYAAIALGKLGRTDDASRALLKLAHGPQDDLWCSRSAAVALATLGQTDQAADALLVLARDDHYGIRERCTAAIALGTLGRTNDAADVLLKLARDLSGDVGVRRNAAETLGVLGRTEAAAEVLLELTRDHQGSAWQRRYAAEALGMLGRIDEAAGVLLALVRDPALEGRLHRFVIESLGNLGSTDRAVLNELLTIVHDHRVEAWERHTAAVALGKLGMRDEALHVLLNLAHDPLRTSAQRRTAAVALGAFGYTDEAAEVLVTLACDSLGDPWERSMAAMALGALGRVNQAVLDGLLLLVRHLSVQDDERSMAAVALGYLGQTDEATDVLLQLACNPQVEAWVRRTAYDSLKRLIGGVGAS